ncbi:MAG: putative 3-oxoacyl-acyl carrier protein synthase [Acidobacteria bacterium]|nr:putative 3-oxoacyl-acyl carrier protein synthase [Acidobacteriota bacterium]
MTVPRVVVTGMGILTSNATSAAEFSDALREARCGIRDITRFDTDFPFKLGGVVDLEGDEDLVDRVSHLATYAARQAVEDSGLMPEELCEGSGVCIGTSRGPAHSLERLLSATTCAETSRALFEEIPFYSIARNIARTLALTGPVTTVTMACVSSSLAIGRAFDTIRRGRAEIMLAGGADSLTSLSFSGFSLLRAMTRSLCRPFDRRRDGIVLGEGAGVLVLENLEHAVARGAYIYAEIAGWGTAGDAHHATCPSPDGRGLTLAVRNALRQAEMTPGEVAHVNLHGTGTAANDPAECRAMQQVFGERAREIPVNSLKPMFGHTLGAAGVLELAGSILGMRDGFIAPTLNTEELDPQCDLNVVRGKSIEQTFEALLSTKSAFGGANVAIVARKIAVAGTAPSPPYAEGRAAWQHAS